MNRLHTLFSPLLARLAIGGTTALQSAPVEKLDGALTPNMRALRLAMSIADQLISMGTPAQKCRSYGAQYYGHLLYPQSAHRRYFVATYFIARSR